MPKLDVRTDQPERAAGGPCTCPCHAGPMTGEGPDVIRPLKEALEGPERGFIVQALNACGGNRKAAAKALG